jgi:hypothetical protein
MQKYAVSLRQPVLVAWSQPSLTERWTQSSGGDPLPSKQP